MEWYHYVLIALVCVGTFGACFYARKKGLLTAQAVKDIGTSLDQLHDQLLLDGREDMFDRLVGYAAAAAHAAEQMCKVGTILPDERKDTAMNIGEEFAQVDGVELNAHDQDALSTLIEGQCNLMGHHSEKSETSNLD